MPHQIPVFQPTHNTRLGRMLAAGRITVTMRSKRSGAHITLTMKSSAKVKGKWSDVPFAEASHVFITQGPGGWGSPKVGTYYPPSGKLYLNQGFDTKPWLYAVEQTFKATVTGAQDTEAFELREAERCGKCGRELTDPVSIARGIGPTCWGDETGSHHYNKADDENYERPRYGDDDFDYSSEHLDGEGRMATEADAHVEWHLNSGVPMGTPGCPQDACHVDEYEGSFEAVEPPHFHEAAVGNYDERAEDAARDKKGRTVPRTFAALASQVKR